jgi:hypothetical protein
MRAARTLVCFSLAIALGGCWSGVYENPAGEYVRRSDTIALNAGNAKDVNAATHVVDPWPRYVNDQRIPSNGERMVGAVQRYQRPAQRSQGQGSGQGRGGQGTTTPPADGGALTPGGSGGTPAATLPF